MEIEVRNAAFKPITIGGMKVPNRLVMPAMVTQFADKSGFVTQRLIDYYVERARHKVGLIIIETACVAQGGRMVINQLDVYDDAFISGLKKLSYSIQKAGAKCVLQINHGGRSAHPNFNSGMRTIAPSAIAPRTGVVPHELTLEEIPAIIEAFVQSARRAREAGFDGIEVHCAHGYLISEFLSPLTNKRTDRYGGDLESRVRLALEVVQRIRETVGENYPVMARLNGDESIKGGLSLNESKKAAQMLEKAGVDALNISSGYHASTEEGYINTLMPIGVAPMPMSHGCYLHLAEEIKKVVKVPVIGVGRLDDPEIIQNAIAQGKVDLIAVGRGLISDPAFCLKLSQGQLEDIRACIGCNQCTLRLFLENELGCSINAEAGREKDSRIKPAAKYKKVLVIGGGPGGMEAARVAALRGHKVTLIERKGALGGNLVAAAAASYKKEIRHAKDYLSSAISKLGIEVKLNTEFNKDEVLAFNANAIILATGALPELPQIPGIDQAMVTDAVKVLSGEVKTGKRIVVVGGGEVGCEVAVFLAENGEKVTLISRRDTDFKDTSGLALDMEFTNRKWLFFELWPKLPIEVIGKSTYKEITKEGLIIQDREGIRRLIPADTVVFAIGMKPNNVLMNRLRGEIGELYEVGDCFEPGNIYKVIHEAARIGRII